MTGQPSASSGTLETALAAALHRLPEALADDRSRDGVTAIARRLPAAMTTGPLGLEIRLAGERVIDVFAAATPGDRAYSGLIACLRAGGWADDARAADLAEVLERWAAGGGALARIARYLLVEADAPAAAALVPVPSIFLAPRGANDLRHPDAGPNAVHRSADASTVAAAELSGVWPDPLTAQALQGVIEAIEPPGEIFAIGAMLSRSAGASMRIAVRRLDAEGMNAVLRAAGLPRQAQAIRAIAQTTCATKQVVAFEVGPGAEARVGLELSPDHDWRRARTEGWPELLGEMVRLGVAEADRAASATSLVHPGSNVEPLWGLAHVKVAVDASGLLPVSKLYVGVQHPDPS